MTIFIYDHSLEGLLSAVFDAYNLNIYPDKLALAHEELPLFVDYIHTVRTISEQADRVWKGLQKKISENALNMIHYVWLSEMSKSDELIFRYIYKCFKTTDRIELNYIDQDVLQMRKVAQIVNKDKHRIIEFVRFQKTKDDIYFSAINPNTNCLPLTINHFTDRFKDQNWIIYDVRRNYGYYYNQIQVNLININNFEAGDNYMLKEEQLDEDELLIQKSWKSYYESMTIIERINPKLHRQHIPKRYWKFLTEKQQQ